MSIIRVLKKFRRILSRHQKIRILELAVLMFLGGCLETFSVSLIMPFMTVMNPEEMMGKWYIQWLCRLFGLRTANSFLVAFSLALALLYLVKNAYLLFELNIQNRFVFGNRFRTQRMLLEVFIHRPYEFFLGVNSGEVLRIINNDTTNTFGLLTTLLSFFTETIVSGMMIVAIFLLSPRVTLLIGGMMLGLLIVITAIIRPILRRAARENQEAGTGMGKWLLQSIQGIKEIKVMGKEDYFVQNYNTYGQRFVYTSRRYQTVSIMPRFFIEGISLGATFFVLAMLLYRGTPFSRIVPLMSTVALAAIRLLPSVNRISGALAQIAYNEPMLDKTIENLRVVKTAGTEGAGERPARRIGNVKRQIELSDIVYHYPDTRERVLDGANMVVRCGESVGVVGASGAGKTTAIDIILGLLCPQEGKVLVDGVDIREDYPGWLAQIAYIPQSIFMLDDSIRANIAFGESAGPAEEGRVWAALEEASLAEFVRSLPEGLETQVGERGMRLSGGQRQRIGIARALYRDPGVLIFDEATSALDNETEASIMESIHSLHGRRTMIIIAHRLSTIEDCDHIYRVEQGKIVQAR